MQINGLTEELRARIAPIKLAVFDVDGVLTDGQLHMLPDGQEVKSFCTLDGLGIKLLQRAGIETAIITGRSSVQVEKRVAGLGIQHLRMSREDKLVALQELWAETGHSAETTAYIGDDWPDLAAIRAVAFGATVNSGHDTVKQYAHWCTRRNAGHGAAREFCEFLLNAQGKLETLFEEFK